MSKLRDDKPRRECFLAEALIFLNEHRMARDQCMLIHGCAECREYTPQHAAADRELLSKTIDELCCN